MSWKHVCNIDQISTNSLKQFEIDGVSIVVANYGDGFRAFPPYCPHMEEPLAGTGLIEDGVLTCSKHLWQWDMRSCEKQGMAEKDMGYIARSAFPLFLLMVLATIIIIIFPEIALWLPEKMIQNIN